MRSEQVARLTLHRHATSFLVVLDRANEELILHQQIREQHAKDYGANAAANESFPRLLRAQLDQWRASEEESEHISHHVVTHDQRNRDDGPDQTLKYILYDQVALGHDNQQRHMSPGEQTELFHVVLLHQRQHEPHEANAVQRERQEPMVSDKESQIFL